MPLLFSALQLLLLLTLPPTLHAQRPELGVAIGPAPVTGQARRVRATGVHGALSAGWNTRASGLGARLELAWEQLPGRDAVAITPHGTQRVSRGTLGIASVRGSVLFTGGAARLRPYALLGGGSTRLRIPGHPNPYGFTVGLHAGVGVRLAVGRLLLTTELLGVLPLTDYGGGGDFQPVTYAPLSVGVRF